MAISKTTILGLICAVGLGWGFHGVSFAQEYSQEDVESAELHNRLGLEHYEAGRYSEAAREMLLAHQAVPEPSILYNVARIYQTMGHAELAQSFFQRFILEPNADPDTVKKALDHLATLNQVPSEGGQRPLELIQPPKTMDEEEQVSPSEEEVADTSVDAANQQETEASIKGPGAPIWLATGGAGLVVGGAAFGAMALAEHGHYMDDSIAYDERLGAKERGVARARTADVLLVSGSLVLIGAGVWWKRSASNRGVSLVPWAGEDSVGMTAQVQGWGGR